MSEADGSQDQPSSVPPPALAIAPAPPTYLSKEARRIWRRLAPILVGCKRLTALDVDQLATYCDITVKLRAAADALGVGLLLPGRRDDFRTNPTWKIYRDLLITFRGLGNELGLTPGARAKLGPPNPTMVPEPPGDVAE